MLDAQKKARLIWHCRRGMLELDLILQRFLQNNIEELTQSEVVVIERMLTHTDPELYSWLMGHEDPKDDELCQIVTLIRTNY